LSYHHYLRLEAHAPKAYGSLTPTTRLVAITIASHLNKNKNQYRISAETLSGYARASRAQVDKAIKDLVAAGIFEVSQSGKRSPRNFKLLVECPESCKARPVDHYTKTELRARGADSVALAESEVHSSQELLHSFEPEVHSFDPVIPQNLATNRDDRELDRDINKDDDHFIFSMISKSLKAMEKTGDLSPDHTHLKAVLDSDPGLVITHARRIMETATGNPETYLKSAIKKYPKSLTKKPNSEKDTSIAKPLSQSSLEIHWRDLSDNNPELIEWGSLSNPYKDFLQRITKGVLTITAAKIANKAQHYQLDLSTCQTITQAGELTSKHPDLETQPGLDPQLKAVFLSTGKAL
jgi:hypothetical protein